MAWNEPGGDKDRDPWSAGDGNKGPPDLDDLIRNLQDRFSGLFGSAKRGGGNGSSNGGDSAPTKIGGFGAGFIMLIALAIWVLSGIYIVDAGKRGVVLRLGAFVDTTMPGPHWRPTFIDSVDVVDVEQRRFVELGYRSAGRNGRAGGTVLREALMLTEDENIVDIRIAIQYQINDPRHYLFNVQDPTGTLTAVAESSIREAIGKSKMDYVLTEGRSEIVATIKDMIQSTLDRYQSGIMITSVNLQDAQPPEEVQGAFEDAIKAREDEQRLKNEAEAYSNEVLPKARGEGARILEESVAYRDQVIAEAEGETSRFLQILTEYQKAPKVTRQRLYIDAMESVLANSSKVMIDTDSNNILMLPLDSLTGGQGGAGMTDRAVFGAAGAVAPSLLDRTRNTREDARSRENR